MRNRRASRFVGFHHPAPNHRHQTGRQSGVTFIELLIAIVILLVGMLACLEFMTVAIAAAVNSQKLVVAKTLAQDTMEQIFVMRDMNCIGGLPPVTARDQSTYPKLFNVSEAGIFPNAFQTVKLDNGPDLIRGTTDDVAGDDPRYVGYTIRILVRSATVDCGAADPSTCPPPVLTDKNKRVIIEVKFPFLKSRRLFTTRLETYMTVPPSQTRVS